MEAGWALGCSGSTASLGQLAWQLRLRGVLESAWSDLQMQTHGFGTFLVPAGFECVGHGIQDPCLGNAVKVSILLQTPSPRPCLGVGPSSRVLRNHTLQPEHDRGLNEGLPKVTQPTWRQTRVSL